MNHNITHNNLFKSIPACAGFTIEHYPIYLINIFDTTINCSAFLKIYTSILPKYIPTIILKLVPCFSMVYNHTHQHKLVCLSILAKIRSKSNNTEEMF